MFVRPSRGPNRRSGRNNLDKTGLVECAEKENIERKNRETLKRRMQKGKIAKSRQPERHDKFKKMLSHFFLPVN
jgi:hypothetical protein